MANKCPQKGGPHLMLLYFGCLSNTVAHLSKCIVAKPPCSSKTAAEAVALRRPLTEEATQNKLTRSFMSHNNLSAALMGKGSLQWSTGINVIYLFGLPNWKTIRGISSSPIEIKGNCSLQKHLSWIKSS